MQLWLLEWRLHVNRSWPCCNLSPASPEMGAQDDPYLLPSTTHYRTNFSILVYLRCEHFYIECSE